MRVENVFRCSPDYFTSYLYNFRQAFVAAEEGGKPFQFVSTAYEGLEKCLKSYEYMPRCFFPLCYDGHWGYMIVEPELSGTARVLWGDSLGQNPPKGILNGLRAYLSLIYRDATFVVDSRNHCTEVLGFEKQGDGYSCGFYVMLIMAKFCGGSGNLQISSFSYEKYSSETTEAIRKAMVSQFILGWWDCELVSKMEEIWKFL